MDYKLFLGAVSITISLISYIPYFRDIFAGRTKPHAFSWLVWSVLTGIGFAGQVVSGAGAGAWVTGFASAVCLLVFLLALTRGEKKIVLLDWLSLAGALLALGFWFITKGPLLSVVLITLVDALGFLPTVRKSIINPREETLSTYALNGLKFVPALLALQTVSVATVLYPFSLVLSNWSFSLLLIIRRRPR